MPSAQPIRFTCGGCGFKIKVSAKHAGRKAKCPDCGSPIVVPKPKPHPKPARPSAGGAIAAAAAPVPKPAPPKDDGFDLDGFELEEPVGYDLNDGDAAEEAEPAWMKLANAADAQAASLPRLGPTQETDKPSLLDLFNADTWGRIAVFGIAFMWLGFILVAVFGIDIMSLMSDNEYDTPGDKATPTGMLIAALITTALLAPLGVYRYRRAWLMLSRGVRVPCMILKTGKFSKNGMLDVTFQYNFDGKTYKPRMSVKQDTIDGITHLRVDPEKPKRCMLDS